MFRPVHCTIQQVRVCPIPDHQAYDTGIRSEPQCYVLDNPNCLNLDPAAILPGSAGAISQTSIQTTVAVRPAQPAIDGSASSTTGPPAASCLASEHWAMAARVFLQEAAGRIATPQVKSTLAIYKVCWLVSVTGSRSTPGSYSVINFSSICSRSIHEALPQDCYCRCPQYYLKE